MNFIDRMRDMMQKIEQPRRYIIRLNRTAEVHLRRMSWPHKWRGSGRSMRHLRPVRAWLRTLEDAVNAPEVCAEIDRAVVQRISQL